MSQKKFISNADEALANFVWRVINEDPDAKRILQAKEQLSFGLPKAIGASKVSIYLYSVEVKAKAEREPVPFVLHYLLTPTTGDEKNDHVLLEKIVHALLSTPQINAADSTSSGLFSKPDTVSPSEVGKLWIALGAPLRLFLSLAVASSAKLLDFTAETAVAIESSAAAQTIPVANDVTSLYQAVLKTFTEQADGWKNRNMVLRQFIFQQFKKIAGVSVDEMLAALKSLGDKLETHKPTGELIKPLNQLAGYYRHQLEELKGMDKMSHNQKENIESVDVWLKEVTALVEALSKSS